MLTETKERGFWQEILLYTVLFAIGAAFVYYYFVFCGRTMLINADVGNFDGFAQTYPAYAKIKRAIETWMNGGGLERWSWDVGLGASFFDFFKGKLVNPLTYLITAAPQEKMDVVYNYVTIFREYLCGLTFLFFEREVGLKREQRVTGAICFAFAGWLIRCSLDQGTFTNATIFFPLLVMGADRILKKKSPMVFIVSVFGLVASGVLWAYISGIVIIFYYLCRYPYYYGKNGVFGVPEQKGKAFAANFGSFILAGVIGLMISFLLLQSMLYSISRAITDNGTQVYDNFYTLRDYLKLPDGFFYYDPVFTPYSMLYIPVLIILLLPLIVPRIRRSTPAFLTVFFFIASLFPITGTIFNGFSYTVGRWFYVLTFFAVWAGIECYDREILKKRSNRIICAVWLLLLGVWIAAGYKVLIIDVKSLYSMITGVAFGLLILLIIAIRETIYDKPGIMRSLAGLAIIFILLGDATGAVNFTLYPGLSENLDRYEKKGHLEQTFQTTTERIIAEVQEEDTTFYRSDRVDTTSARRVARMVGNANQYWGNRSIYEYSSMINGSWLYFNKMMGNNAGYFDRTISYSNDNRAALDYLMGVKYFLGDNAALEPGATEYAPYGFSYYETIDGVDVLKNEYCMGLGTTFDRYITESELETFAPLEREQVLMQAAVVPDDAVESLTGVEHASLDDLRTDMTVYECEICNPENVELTGTASGGSEALEILPSEAPGEERISCSEPGTIKVYSPKGYFDLYIPRIENCQVIVSFDELVRDTNDFDEFLDLLHYEDGVTDNATRNAIDRKSFIDNERYRVYLKKGNVRKGVLCEKGKRQGFNDVTDFNINMGYYESIEGKIRVEMSQYGNYSFDSIKVYAIPMDIYEENAQILDARSYQIEDFENEKFTGTVDAEKDSILYLSILDDKGWKIYIDGKKADKIHSVDLAFTGAVIPAGHHEVVVEYKYPGLKSGIAVTTAGVVLLIIVMVRRRKNIKERNS